jgi:hypothetical protein
MGRLLRLFGLGHLSKAPPGIPTAPKVDRASYGNGDLTPLPVYSAPMTLTYCPSMLPVPLSSSTMTSDFRPEGWIAL